MPILTAEALLVSPSFLFLVIMNSGCIVAAGVQPAHLVKRHRCFRELEASSRQYGPTVTESVSQYYVVVDVLEPCQGRIGFEFCINVLMQGTGKTNIASVHAKFAGTGIVA